MMVFKILLIDANGQWISKSKATKEQVVLPIGLMYLSSFIKRKYLSKIDVKLINTLIDIKEDSEIENFVKDYNPDLIGLRVLSSNFEYFKKILGLIKKNTNCPIIAGGPHVNLDPKSVLLLDEIDYVAIGEGEEILSELVGLYIDIQSNDNNLDKNKSTILKDSLTLIDGLGFKSAKTQIINRKRAFIEDIDTIPFPDYTIIDQFKYSQVLNYGYSIRKQGLLLTSRGCPFCCDYCFNFYGRRYRKRSAKNIFDELTFLYDEYGIRDFFIVDDTFNIDRQRCIDFFNMIITSKIKINLFFTSGLRGDLLDKELIDLMVLAGTYTPARVDKRLDVSIPKTTFSLNPFFLANSSSLCKGFMSLVISWNILTSFLVMFFKNSKVCPTLSSSKLKLFIFFILVSTIIISTNYTYFLCSNSFIERNNAFLSIKSNTFQL